MLPDLERLIRLQRLDNAKVEARRAVDAIPSRITELDTNLDTSRARVDEARQRLADQKNARLAVEKTLAEVQARLSRFKDQMMAVKTNKEYSAIQHEIATAEADVRRLEDDILEHMLAVDELTAKVKSAEQTEVADCAEAERTRTKLDAERTVLEGQLVDASHERVKLSQKIGSDARRLFDSIASQRQGLAVVEARDGHCTLCNVRLRPQVFNQILLNTELIRCDSCMRILYHDPDSANKHLSTDDEAR